MLSGAEKAEAEMEEKRRRLQGPDDQRQPGEPDMAVVLKEFMVLGAVHDHPADTYHG